MEKLNVFSKFEKNAISKTETKKVHGGSGGDPDKEARIAALQYNLRDITIYQGAVYHKK